MISLVASLLLVFYLLLSSSCFSFILLFLESFILESIPSFFILISSLLPLTFVLLHPFSRSAIPPFSSFYTRLFYFPYFTSFSSFFLPSLFSFPSYYRFPLPALCPSSPPFSVSSSSSSSPPIKPLSEQPQKKTSSLSLLCVCWKRRCEACVCEQGVCSLSSVCAVCAFQ